MSIAHNLIFSGVALWFVLSSFLFPLGCPGDDTDPEMWANGLATTEPIER